MSRRDEIDAPLVLAPGLSHRALVENILWIVERNARTPGLVSLYVNLSAEATDPAHPAHDYFVQRYRVLRESLIGAFTVLLNGRDAPTPEMAAQQFLALQDGLQVQWLLEPEVVNMRATALSYLRGLGIELPEEPILRRPETATDTGRDLMTEASNRNVASRKTDPPGSTDHRPPDDGSPSHH